MCVVSCELMHVITHLLWCFQVVRHTCFQSSFRRRSLVNNPWLPGIATVCLRAECRLGSFSKAAEMTWNEMLDCIWFFPCEICCVSAGLDMQWLFGPQVCSYLFSALFKCRLDSLGIERPDPHCFVRLNLSCFPRTTLSVCCIAFLMMLHGAMRL